MKDLKISKELLSEVLGYEVYAFLGISENEIDYTCCRDKDIGYEDTSINIYEFAFKCKEWALTKGYFIYSTNELSFIKSFSLETIETFSNGKDTEIECILKACEYILKDNIGFMLIETNRKDDKDYNDKRLSKPTTSSSSSNS